MKKLIFLLLLIAVIVISCTSKQKDADLIGSWKLAKIGSIVSKDTVYQNSEELKLQSIVELKNDGNFTEQGAVNGELKKLDGKWYTKDNTIFLEFVMGVRQKLKYKKKQGQLLCTVKNEKGETQFIQYLKLSK